MSDGKRTDIKQAAHYSTRIYRGYLVYLEKKFGLEQAKRIVHRTGVSWAYLSRESNWVSEEFAEIFYDVLVSEPGIDPDFSYQAGRLSMSPELQGAVQLLMIQMLEPRSIYTQLAYFTSRFNQIDSLTVNEISRKFGKFTFQSHRDSRHLPLIEQNWRGFMEAVPAMVGLPMASFKVVERDGRSFTFELSWMIQRRFQLLRSAKVLLTLGAPGVFLLGLWELSWLAQLALSLCLLTLYCLVGLLIEKSKERLSGHSRDKVSLLLQETEERYAELRQSQLDLDRRLHETRLLNKVLQQINASYDSRDLIETTLHELKANLEYDRLAYFEFGQAEGKLKAVASQGFDPLEKSVLERITISIGPGPENKLDLGQVFQRKESVLIPVSREFFNTFTSETQALVHLLKPSSFVACSVATHESRFGMLFVDYVNGKRRLNPDDLQIVRSVSNHLAVCLENAEQFDRERKLRLSFQRFVPSQVVQAMIGEGKFDLEGGTSQEMTVLYSDLRDFTQRCSNMEPQLLIKALNYYLQNMTDIVYQHGGIVDKFMGDGILAEFNIFDSTERHVEKAVAAACAMQTRMSEINRWIRDELFSGRDWAPLEAGIGIHTGVAIVGNLGTQNKTEFTAIGDTVNLACRLGEVSKRYPGSIVVSSAVHSNLHGRFRSEPLGLIRIRGLQKEESAHLVLGEKFEEKRTLNDNDGSKAA